MRSLIEQLVQVIAPMVREIAAHSLSPEELVLRRMLGDGRREEIFITKTELRTNLEGLNDEDRRLFDPLELDAAKVPATTPRPRSPLPPPLPLKRANRPPPLP